MLIWESFLVLSSSFFVERGLPNKTGRTTNNKQRRTNNVNVQRRTHNAEVAPMQVPLFPYDTNSAMRLSPSSIRSIEVAYDSRMKPPEPKAAPGATDT